MGMSVPDWWRMMATQRARIHPAFWLRSLAFLFTAIGNAPLQIWEYLRFSSAIKKEQVIRPVFILGHPRSGTTHLHYLLSKDERFRYCSVYEAIVPHIFLTGGHLFRRMIAGSLPPTRPQDEVSMSIDSPKEEEFAMAVMSRWSYMNCFYFPSAANRNFDRSVMLTDPRDKAGWQRHFDYFLKKLTFRNEGKALLMKSPANTGRMAEIAELYPDACFVHICRHPYEVFQSTVRLFEKVVPLTAMQKPDAGDLEEFVIRAYRDMYAKYAAVRKKMSPDQLIEVRYEDLDARPEEVLSQIYAQLRIPLTDQALQGFREEIERTSAYRKNSYHELPEELRKRLQVEWKDAFELFSYPF